MNRNGGRVGAVDHAHGHNGPQAIERERAVKPDQQVGRYVNVGREGRGAELRPVPLGDVAGGLLLEIDQRVVLAAAVVVFGLGYGVDHRHRVRGRDSRAQSLGGVARGSTASR